MIEKKIHYCWFGGNPMPESAKKCIESWKKFCPDYEIIEWNESNFDVNYNDYAKEAAEKKKWGFVSDITRSLVLVQHGGIYMDTDVELLKPLDDLLELDGFIGCENTEHVSMGIIACKKGDVMMKGFFDLYENEHFILEGGKINWKTSVARSTQLFKDHGFLPNGKIQKVEEITVFPPEWFYPKDFETKELNITENTYAVHHFDGSWGAYELIKKQKKAAKKEQRYRKIKTKLKDLFGEKFYGKIKKLFKRN